MRVKEDTGHDSYLCDYEATEMRSLKDIDFDELDASQGIEYTKMFLLKYGREIL